MGLHEFIFLEIKVLFNQSDDSIYTNIIILFKHDSFYANIILIYDSLSKEYLCFKVNHIKLIWSIGSHIKCWTLMFGWFLLLFGVDLSPLSQWICLYLALWGHYFLGYVRWHWQYCVILFILKVFEVCQSVRPHIRPEASHNSLDKILWNFQGLFLT